MNRKTSLYTAYIDDYTDHTGEQVLELYGWCVMSTYGTEVWEVDGPFATEEEAERRRQQIEDEAAELDRGDYLHF